MRFLNPEKTLNLLGAILIFCANLAAVYMWFRIDMHARSGSDFWFFLADSFLPAAFFMSLVPTSIGVWLILLGNFFHLITNEK